MLTSVLGGRSEANMADSAPLSMVSGPLWLLKVCHNSFDFERCVLIGKECGIVQDWQTWSYRCQHSPPGLAKDHSFSDFFLTLP